MNHTCYFRGRNRGVQSDREYYPENGTTVISYALWFTVTVKGCLCYRRTDESCGVIVVNVY